MIPRNPFLLAALVLLPLAAGCNGGSDVEDAAATADEAVVSPVTADGYPPAITPELNTEEYAHIAENGFRDASTTPLSTFAIDVDRASYANVRRFVNQGRMPPADAVRIEELVNYFDYDDPDPTGEHPFAVRTEVAPSPWNPANRLVRIGIQGRRMEREELPPGNLVFLVDVSGSMNAETYTPTAFKRRRASVTRSESVPWESRIALTTPVSALARMGPIRSCKGTVWSESRLRAL